MNDLTRLENEPAPKQNVAPESLHSKTAVLSQIAQAEQRAEKFLQLKDDHQYWRDLAIENPSAWLEQRQQMNAERVALLQEGQQLHNKLRKVEQLIVACASRARNATSNDHRYPSYMTQLPPNLQLAARFS